MTNLLALRSFLDRSLVRDDSLQWLFLLSFPHGGSTATARLLLTAPDTVALNDPVEGAWRVPAMVVPGKRWRPDYKLWYRKIRAVWLRDLRKGRSDRKRLVIEKSPSNMCRYRQLLDTFSTMEPYLVVLTRDPYATCASWRRRRRPEYILTEWYPALRREIADETEYCALLAEIWLIQARLLAEAITSAKMHIRYEDLTENPNDTVEKLRAVIPPLGPIAIDEALQVKDYEPQRLRNMNAEQIALLNEAEIAAISSVLRSDPDTVNKLGYSIEG